MMQMYIIKLKYHNYFCVFLKEGKLQINSDLQNMYQREGAVLI